ncbi:MAG: transcription antitermination factor NusB [Planctomycetaceae bacterium]|nr:transcription antitermination factor NusB [Planctomycetaceae bacterium]
MPKRRDARKAALQMLYLLDQNPDADLNRIHRNLTTEIVEPSLVQFAWSLVNGVQQHRPALDDAIRRTARNWKLERMAPTDRNVLRMGLYELQQMGTPAPVVLNESIEIAREFGTAQSAAFVNGILDKLAGETAARVAPAAETGESTN